MTQPRCALTVTAPFTKTTLPYILLRFQKVGLSDIALLENAPKDLQSCAYVACTSEPFLLISYNSSTKRCLLTASSQPA